MAVLNLELETEVTKDEVNDYLRNENGYLTPGWCASWRVQPGDKENRGIRDWTRGFVLCLRGAWISFPAGWIQSPIRRQTCHAFHLRHGCLLAVHQPTFGSFPGCPTG